MNPSMKKLYNLALLLMAFFYTGSGQGIPSGSAIYMVSNTHFDTQFMWTTQTSINNYLPKTMSANFRLFEKYPDYVFNFEGAIRYMWMKEYYPYEYGKVKEYVKLGRWNIAGSSLDANDVQVPSPESQIRNILLGQNFYKSEFNKKSYDIFLPDCFGFGYALPSIAVHCGLKGFATQKLTWGSAYGIPFEMGVWEGPDGARIFAVLDAGDYRTAITKHPALDSVNLKSMQKTFERSGFNIAYKLYGIGGDKGGSPDEKSVETLQKALKEDKNITIIPASTDLLCRQLTPAQFSRLPVYKGELPLTMHGAGCYTSQAFMKYINRKNELTADAAERAMVAASWLGAAYPQQKLNEAWTRFLFRQFHDDITGTSIPEAYPFSWNDELISNQQFANVLEHGAATVIQAMDTRVKGIPVVVYNALSIARNEPVEAAVSLPSGTSSCKVFNKAGKEVPSQIIRKDNQNMVLFLASVPANGFEVYDIQPSNTASAINSGLKIAKQWLENQKYKVTLDANGDISSIIDKSANKELLEKPIRLEMRDNETPEKPAWRIYYKTITSEPRSFVGNVKSIEVEESGSVRVSLKITRETEGSVFVQRIRLSAGDAGERVDVVNEIDWNTRNTLLKASFQLTVADTFATYDLGMGTIRRGNNKPYLCEVPAQQWADIASHDGTYGVSILNDSKYGWDKPADNTLRLTLLHSPMIYKGLYYYQTYQDLGKHQFIYSISGHRKSWKAHATSWQAACLNQPLLAFQTDAHQGHLGNSFSMASVSSKQVAVKALKKAEGSNDIVIRLQDLAGEKAEQVSITFPKPVKSAKELNGIEEEIGTALVKDGKLVVTMSPYQPRTIAVTLDSSSFIVPKIKNTPLVLKYNRYVTTKDGNRTVGTFDNCGHSIPEELLPAEINSEGVLFKIQKGKRRAEQNNALIPLGDTLTLPSGNYNRIYLLAAATEDAEGEFTVDGKPVEIRIQDYSGFIGQWYSPVFDRPMDEEIQVQDVKFVKRTPAYLKTDNIAWIGTHRHSVTGINEAYTFCYLYKYAVDIPHGAKTLVLPNNDKIRIMAITLAEDPNSKTKLVSPLKVNL